MLIGFSGYAGSGKSTAAKMLLPLGYGLLKFARPLKDMLRTFLRSQGASDDLIERMIEGDLKEVPSDLLGGKTPRYAMQTLGTDWGRALIDENLWCDAAIRAAPVRAVSDDVRFENESSAIRCRGGLVFRITRPGVGPVNDHISEELPPYDVEIVNSGEPIDMFDIIDWWMSTRR